MALLVNVGQPAKLADDLDTVLQVAQQHTATLVRVVLARVRPDLRLKLLR